MQILIGPENEFECAPAYFLGRVKTLKVQTGELHKSIFSLMSFLLLVKGNKREI